MKTKTKVGLYCVFYSLYILGLLTIVVLRLLNIIQKVDLECIYLIILLSVLVVIPQFKKIKIKDLELEARNSISKAEEGEIEENSKEEDKDLKEQSKGSCAFSSEKIKEKIFNSYCNKKSVDGKFIESNRKIICDGDPINSNNPVFSWYHKRNFQEYFIEAKFTQINSAYYNKLYVMLSKINLYNQTEPKKLSLVLLILENDPDRNVGVSSDNIDDLRDVFASAIDSRLLKLEFISPKDIEWSN